MAITVADLLVRFASDTTGAEQGIERVDNQIEGLDKRIGAVGKSMQDAGTKLTAGVTVPILGAAVAAVGFASDLSESTNKVQVVFGNQASAVSAFADNADTALGQTKQQALEALGTFGSLFKTMGIGQKPAADMSQGLVKLASDLASFNNLDPTEALEKLKSGLVGEAEPLRSLGIQLDAATVKQEAMRLGLAKSEKDISAAALAQARYSLIMKQTQAAQGDFARTSDGLANSQRIIGALFKDTAASFGQVLLPTVEQGAAYLKGLLTSFNGLSDGTKRFIVYGALAAAAIGPLLLGLGTLISFAAAAAPAIAGIGGALGLLVSPIGLIAAGLGALVYFNWDTITDDVSSYASAVREAGFGSIEAQEALDLLPPSLQGVARAADQAMGSVIAAAKGAYNAFNEAGGGVNGFAAALSSLTGKDIKIDLSQNIVKLHWGDVFDFSGGIDWKDWSKGFVKLKVGDMFDFSQDWTQGFTKLKISDLLDFATGDGKTTIKISDLFTFDKTVEKTTFKVADFFSFDSTGGKVKIKVGDLYELDQTTGKQTIKIGDYVKIDTTGGKTKLSIGDFYELGNGKETLKFGDYFAWETSGEKTRLRIGDYVVLDSTKTTLKFGDWFTWDLSGIKLDLKSLLPEKIDLSNIFNFKPEQLKITAPDMSNFKWPAIPSPTNWKWPEFPKVTIIWPDAPKIIWPPLPSWSWPAMPKFDWPALPKFAWPALPSFSWPALPKWSWPSIPSPAWLQSLLNFHWPALPGLSDLNPFAPKKASGDPFWRGGLVTVHDGPGGEILNLPNGTQIVPHDVSVKAAAMALAGAGRGTSVTINMYATVDNKIDIKQLAYEVAGEVRRRVR